jgi:heme A synthase
MVTHQPHSSGKFHRLASAALGLLLLGVGIYAWLLPETTGLLRYGSALLFVVLGANAVYCAWRAKPSWLTRIGPLP